MQTNAKIFGQLRPAAATLSDLCVIATGREGQMILTACNQAATEERLRVAVLPSGASLGPQHYVLYDTLLPANGVADLPLDLPAGATIRVYSLGGNVSFTAAGLEVTP